MSRVRVMTWNLENLFLPGQDGGPDTEAAFQAKLASLAAVIVVSEGAQHLYQLQEHWISHRSTAEALKHERYLYLKRFASSGDMIRPLLAAWPYETNCLPPQRPRPA
jgi:hypothetical protein